MGFRKKLLEIHDEAPHSSPRKNIYALIVLSLLVCSIYSNSLNCSWHFDDWANIGDNPNVQLTKGTWDQIQKTLSSNRANPRTPYRPVAAFSFASTRPTVTDSTLGARLGTLCATATSRPSTSAT